MVPEVVVFMAVGILIGPHGPLPLITDKVLQKLSVLTNFTVGAVMFLIGERLLLSDLRRYGKRIVSLILGQGILTGLLVGIVTRIAGAPLTLSVILGIIATETGALTVAAVCSKERRGAEQTASFLMSAVGVANVVTAFAFGIVYPLLLTASGRVTGFGEVILVFIKITAASFGIGIVVGTLLVFVAKYFDNNGELLIAQIIALLIVVPVSSMVGSSVVISMLIAGLISVNVAPGRATKLFASLKVLESPMYLVFFLIAGADFDPGLLLGAGEIGGAYILARAFGKVFGALLAYFTKAIPFRKSLSYGAAMLPHAGLAVGLIAFVVQRSPNLGERTSTIVLASIILFETIGPIFTRQLLKSSKKIESRELLPVNLEYVEGQKINVLLFVDSNAYHSPHLTQLLHMINRIGAYTKISFISRGYAIAEDKGNSYIDNSFLIRKMSEITTGLDMEVDCVVTPIVDILNGDMAHLQEIRFDLIILCNSEAIRNQARYIKSALERYLVINSGSLLFDYDLPFFLGIKQVSTDI